MWIGRLYFTTKLKKKLPEVDSFGCVIENGWCYFPWNSKGITGKCLSRGSRQGKNEKKSSIFHRTMEMKRPHTITEPFVFTLSKAVSRQKTDILFLGVPKNRPTNTPAIESANEKTEEKTVFSPCGRDKKVTSHGSTLSKLFRFVFITRTVY